MATKKKGTLAKAGSAVKKAAKTVAKKTEDYVVKPVGKALGLSGTKKASKSSGGKKASSAKASKTTAKKKAAPKRTTKSAK